MTLPISRNPEVLAECRHYERGCSNSSLNEFIKKSAADWKRKSQDDSNGFDLFEKNAKRRQFDLILPIFGGVRVPENLLRSQLIVSVCNRDFELFQTRGTLA